MGLDQYLLSVPPRVLRKARDPTNPTDQELGIHIGSLNSDRYTIHYWRNHRGLQQWMSDMRRQISQDPKLPEFNDGHKLKITLDILKQLSKDIRSGEVEYGWSDFHTRKKDMAVITKARNEIKRGRTVFYSPSW